MTGAQIIDELLIYLNLNAKQLSDSIGYERPQIIYDIKKGKTKRISNELADKIISVYPEISLSWLLSGEGEMLRPVQNVTHGKNFSQTGDVHVTESSDIDKLIELIKGELESINAERAGMVEERKERDKQIATFQEQINRLLTLLEKK